MKVNVQFSDEDQNEIISFFAIQQNAQGFPHQGEVDVSDPRWDTFYYSLPVTCRFGLPEPSERNG